MHHFVLEVNSQHLSHIAILCSFHPLYMFVCNLCMQPNLSALLSLLPSSPVQRIETPLWSGPQLQSHQLLDISCICPNLANEGWNMVYVMQLVQMRGGTVEYFCYATYTNEGWNSTLRNLYKWGVEQYNILLCNLYNWGVELYNIHLLCNLCRWHQTGANEGWNTVQYSFVMQIIQMRSNLCKWGVEHRTMNVQSLISAFLNATIDNIN